MNGDNSWDQHHGFLINIVHLVLWLPYLPTIGNSNETSRTTVQPASCSVIVLNTPHHRQHLVYSIAVKTTVLAAYGLRKWLYCYSIIVIPYWCYSKQWTPVMFPVIFLYHHAKPGDSTEHTGFLKTWVWHQLGGDILQSGGVLILETWIQYML